MGERVRNLVLYAVAGGVRRPLISVSESDALSPLELSAKVSSAASREYARCDQSGSEHPRLKLVAETREADEQGKLTFAEYAECGPDGKAVSDPVPNIEALFAEKK